MESVEREPNEILAMQKCGDEKYLAVITGKNLIMAQQKFNQLYLFKREPDEKGGRDKFVQTDRIVLRENPAFDKVCCEFHFVCAKDNNSKGEAIMFTNRNEVFVLDITVGDI